MPIRASVFIATSLDGFIAREDGSIDWLPTPDNNDKKEDYGYKEFMDSVDALVMGRNTFETVLSFGGAWPYGDKPVFVLTTRGVDIPEEIRKTVSSMAPDPLKVAQRLDEDGFHHLYIDGGKTIQGFLKEGLVDQMIITKVPVLIGSGIPLFGPITNDIQLDHIETHSFPNGLVQSRYKVI